MVDQQLREALRGQVHALELWGSGAEVDALFKPAADILADVEEHPHLGEAALEHLVFERGRLLPSRIISSDERAFSSIRTVAAASVNGCKISGGSG
ncbi:MAG: hypothetical protein R2748_34355 [Bryobacterales bacterium]